MKNSRIWGSGLSPFFVPEDFVPTRPSLQEDGEADVLVIGGGLSGLLCAYFLLKAGRKVTVVTENCVGGGASRYGIGFLPGDGGTELVRTFRMQGREGALARYRGAAASVNLLEHVVREIGSHCDFRRRDAFLYTPFTKGRDSLREEYFLRLHAGTPCRWLDREACEEEFSFPCAGGIRTEGGGAEFNGVRLCRDLADWILLHGGQIYEGTRVEAVEAESPTRYYAQSGSFRITATAVVDARGGEVLEKNPTLGQRITLFCVVTEPISVFRGWPDRCLIRNRDEGTVLRTTPDGRILYCGEASPHLAPDGRLGAVDGEPLCRVKYRNMEEDLQELFFGIPRVRVEYRFRLGTVRARKGLPFFGRDPRWSGLYYLYPFGEGGIGVALLGASRLSRMICDPTLRGPAEFTLP